MTNYETLLNLIETVNPDDTEMLDEIDELVRAYVFGKMEYLNERHFMKYTRSRDALKAIRPKEWSIHELGKYESGDWYVILVNPDNTVGKKAVASQGMPTEELAELHAIIQAIEYERKNNE